MGNRSPSGIVDCQHMSPCSSSPPAFIAISSARLSPPYIHKGAGEEARSWSKQNLNNMPILGVF